MLISKMKEIVKNVYSKRIRVRGIAARLPYLVKTGSASALRAEKTRNVLVVRTQNPTWNAKKYVVPKPD